MVSIIISSVNKDQLKNISENIAETVGVPFEIIATNNSKGEKGLCQVYNEAVAKVNYDIICFMHEDIIIKTQDWGKVLISIFKDPEIGLIGVAGSSYRPLTPSNWGSFGLDTIYVNIIQSFKYTRREDIHDYINPRNEKLTRVTCVDGVWLSTTKKVASEFKFDENTFKGFHGYDIDYSLTVGQKYKVAVTYDILINHLSEGRYDHVWMEDNIKLFYKWNKILPYNLEESLTPIIIHGEKVAFKSFIDQLIIFKFPLLTALKILYSNNRFYKLSPKLFYKLQFYILKKYLGRK